MRTSTVNRLRHLLRAAALLAPLPLISGWSSGCVSAVDSDGRTIFVADAHRDDGKRFVVHADEKLTAFTGLELACACGELA
jgi:hypothetical protein